MKEGSPKNINTGEQPLVPAKRGGVESLMALSVKTISARIIEMRNSPLLDRKRLEDIVGGLQEHLQEKVFARFRLDRVKEDLGLPSDQKGQEAFYYRSGWMGNAHELASGVLALAPGRDFIKTLRERCNFSEDQRNRGLLINVTESQFTEMASAIAESGQPLKYSRNEEELLHEVYLATEVKALSLDEITAARFDADAAKGKYNNSSSLIGDYRLLSVPAIDGGFLSVSINPDTKRGEDALKYTLEPVSGSYPGIKTREDALKSFVGVVEYCSGKGASKDIQYFESKPLIK